MKNCILRIKCKRDKKNYKYHIEKISTFYLAKIFAPFSTPTLKWNAIFNTTMKNVVFTLLCIIKPWRKSSSNWINNVVLGIKWNKSSQSFSACQQRRRLPLMLENKFNILCLATWSKIFLDRWRRGQICRQCFNTWPFF